MARPERFELPTSWFVARRVGKNDSLQFVTVDSINQLAGRSLQLSPNRARLSSEKQDRVPQESRNLMAIHGLMNPAAHEYECHQRAVTCSVRNLAANLTRRFRSAR
jgi:hypothetical protein